MKAIITLITLFFVSGLYGQEVKDTAETNLRICHGGIKLVYIDGVKPRTLEDYSFYNIESNQVLQPTTINELPSGTMPLSEDLPYVHTIRGAVYTADYLRYTVRN